MRFHAEGHYPKDGEIFVFGANLLGIHSIGDARVARNNFGALRGLSEGPSGSSYAIPVRDAALCNLSREAVTQAVERFIDYAKAHPCSRFFVTKVGGGFGGMAEEAAASMFLGSPDNCSFSSDWMAHLSLGNVK